MNKKLKNLETLKTKLLNDSISKDETRPFLQGFNHNAKLKALVSSNGFTACILRSRYESKLSGLVIDPKTHTIINLEYPNIARVVPDWKKLKTTTIKIEKRHFVKTKIPTKIYFSDINNALTFDKPERYAFCLNAAFLKNLVDTDVAIAYGGEVSPILVALHEDNFDADIFMIMPLNIKEN
ncbi:MAG: hypothetical protein IID03_12435 [Candidatus Dadabacteria bacterium]|nr:hypothetical protein [Candidatus Dadabacteria bacterium]